MKAFSLALLALLGLVGLASANRQGQIVVQTQQIRRNHPLLNAATLPLRLTRNTLATLAHPFQRVTVAPQRVIVRQSLVAPQRVIVRQSLVAPQVRFRAPVAAVSFNSGVYTQSQLLVRNRLQLNQLNRYSFPTATAANIAFQNHGFVQVPQRQIQSFLTAPVVYQQQRLPVPTAVSLRSVEFPVATTARYINNVQRVVVPQQYIIRQAEAVVPVEPLTFNDPGYAEPLAATASCAPATAAQVVVPSTSCTGTTANLSGGFRPY